MSPVLEYEALRKRPDLLLWRLHSIQNIQSYYCFLIREMTTLVISKASSACLMQVNRESLLLEQKVWLLGYRHGPGMSSLVKENRSSSLNNKMLRLRSFLNTFQNKIFFFRCKRQDEMILGFSSILLRFIFTFSLDEMSLHVLFL